MCSRVAAPSEIRVAILPIILGFLNPHVNRRKHKGVHQVDLRQGRTFEAMTLSLRSISEVYLEIRALEHSSQGHLCSALLVHIHRLSQIVIGKEFTIRICSISFVSVW